MSLRYAYNTNGLANHRLDDALAFLADSGYAGVALTLDHGHLDPFAPTPTRRRSGARRAWRSSVWARSSRRVPGSCWTRGPSTSRRS